MGSHLREEGSLGYDSGLVRLRVQTKLGTYFNCQHSQTTTSTTTDEMIRALPRLHEAAARRILSV
jgi:hypothetical protein